MNMNELKVNLENLTEEERKQLTTLLEKSQKPKKVGTWFPEYGEQYWIVTASGACSIYNSNDENDSLFFDIADPCKTEEEAIKRFERNKALVKVNRQVRDIIANEYPEYKVNWKNRRQQKVFPYYDHERGCVCFWNSTFPHQTNFLFEFAPSGVWERIDEELIKKAMGV